jgi:trimeric autotransporter adhesin
VGQVFNAATALATGGHNANNLTEFNNDMTAVEQGLTAITNNKTMLAQIESGETATAAALTTIHLQTALAQVNLQLDKFDGLYASDPNVAGRSTNDNLLDIIDIIQNDANLNKAAGGSGNPSSVGGFAEEPAFLNGAGGVNAHGGTVTQYQDNQAQTNFWAAFLAEANTINAQLQKVATGGEQASQALITQIQNYQQFGANFDNAQGGVFGARFDNELLSGTLLTDTNNAVQGLTGILNGDTGAKLAADHAQIIAAGTGFTADANDVSGNNIPLGGGSYVGTATTVSTATSVHGVAQGTIPVTATPNIANGTGGTAASSTTTSSGGGNGSSGGSGANGAGSGSQANGGGNGSGAGNNGNGSGSGENTGSAGNGNGTGTSQHHDPGHGGSEIATDIGALLQALQGGNATAINTALTALETDVQNDPGAASGANHMHFAHLWH